MVALSAVFYGYRQFGWWNLERGTNIVDSGCPYYEVYECADGRYMAFAPIEERFYATAIDVLGVNPSDLPDRNDEAAWPQLRSVLADAFRAHPMAHWQSRFRDVDACVTPVLDFDEAVTHEHHVARELFVDVDGATSVAPTPRFSGTPAARPSPGVLATRASVASALGDWLPPARIDELIENETLMTSTY